MAYLRSTIFAQKGIQEHLEMSHGLIYRLHC